MFGEPIEPSVKYIVDSNYDITIHDTAQEAATMKSEKGGQIYKAIPVTVNIKVEVLETPTYR